MLREKHWVWRCCQVQWKLTVLYDYYKQYGMDVLMIDIRLRRKTNIDGPDNNAIVGRAAVAKGGSPDIRRICEPWPLEVERQFNQQVRRAIDETARRAVR